MTATNAKTAAQDTSTIAYLGDYNSAATAVSLPLINAAGILQVSPASPYVGLTSSLDAGQDEPERFYPSGQRTFGRLQPGDPAQAPRRRADARAARDSVYVLDDQDPFEVPLASLIGEQAEAQASRVAGARQHLDRGRAASRARSTRSRERRAGRVLRRRHGAGTVALWRHLHAPIPRLLAARVERSRSPNVHLGDRRSGRRARI